MDSITNNNIGKVSYMQQEGTNTQTPSPAAGTEKPIEDGDKKSQDLLKWAGVIAAGTLAVGGTIYALKRGKTVKLDDIKFNKGTASLKEGGKKFSGTIKDTLKSGDTIKMTYQDGVLQKSVRKGKMPFVKEYAYADGKISKVIKDGKEIDIQKLYADGLEKAKKLQAQSAQSVDAELKTASQNYTRAAEDIKQELQQLQDDMIAREQKALDKMQEAQKKSQEIAKEAAKRTELEKEAATQAKQAQKKIMSAVDASTGKSARESARVFMNPNERIDDIMSDSSLTSNIKGIKAVQNRAKFIKGRLKPETITSLNDKQIGTLLSRTNNHSEFVEAAKILETDFSADELQKISKSIYDNTFINNLFDAVRDPAQKGKIVEWYKKIQ